MFVDKMLSRVFLGSSTVRRESGESDASELNGAQPVPVVLAESAEEHLDPTDSAILAKRCKEIERRLRKGREYERMMGDLLLPDLFLEQYDRDRRELWGFLGTAIVLALGILALSFLPFGIRIGNQSAGPITTFNIHMSCMSGLMIVLSGLAILTYRIFPEVHPWYLNFVHGGAFTLVLIGMTAGLVVMVLDHRRFGFGHLQSLHSWLGAALWILFVATYVSGTLLPGCCKRCESECPRGWSRWESHRPALLRFHRTAGPSVVFLSALTAGTGLSQASFYLSIPVKVSSSNTGLIILNVLGVLLVLFLTAIFILMFDYRFRRRARPQWETLYVKPKNVHEGQGSSETLVSKEDLFKVYLDKMVAREEEVKLIMGPLDNIT